MATKVEADPLYSRLNARGRKELKPSGKNALAERFSDYAGLGLPAHKAAMDGNIECLKEVYRSMHNVGVPSRDVNGATALHLAVRSNKVEAVKWLVKFTDLSPLTNAKHDETPFHVAAALGHTASLKVLLSAETKGDIKSQVARSNDNSGFTALNLAIVRNNNEAAKLLISKLGTKGVSPSEEEGISSAHIAASAGNVDVLKMIARKHKKLLSQKDSDGTTPLYFAAQAGRLEALKYIHKVTNSDLSESDMGLKPIHAACQLGHTHIVKYIVACHGSAAILQKTADDATPLHYASSAGQTRTARWLVNSDISGTLINAKDVNGDTAAHDAADNGQTEALDVLLESGADLYAVNNDGNTPYSVAVSGPHLETANFVMTYASKSPQKSDSLEEPSQMTISDLQQGSVDVVTTDTNIIQLQKEMEQSITTAGNKGLSFHNVKGYTPQSFQRDQKGVRSRGSAGERVLHMTDAELALFETSESKVQVIVRYSGVDEHPSSSKSANDSSEVAPSEFATVNELAISEEQKYTKRSRKITKSIMTALKPKQKVADAPKPANEAFTSPEMGFKSHFHSNPLHDQLQVGSGVSTPPTLPATPATGSVLSDEVHQHAIEVEDDDTPYDMHVYAKPDPEVIKQKAVVKKQEEESENTKLLEDALFDDVLPPPVPDRSTDDSETDDKKDSAEEQPVTAMPSVLRKWPPANATKDSDVQPKPEVKCESAGPPSVLRKWPMTESSEPNVTQSPAKPKPSVTSKWPPARKWPPSPEPERAAVQPVEETTLPSPEPEAEHSRLCCPRRIAHHVRRDYSKLEQAVKKIPSSVCQLHLPPAEEEGENAPSLQPVKPAIALMMGWIGSNIRSLRHFAPVYTSLGIPVLCCAPSLWSVWLTSQGNKITSRILQTLDEGIDESSSLILHIFSGGGYVVFPKLGEEASKESLLTRKLIPTCTVFDSGPTDFSFKSGTSGAKLKYKQGGYNFISYASANTVGTAINLLIGARKRSERKQALRSKLFDIPQLYLHSDNDPVCPPEWVAGVMEEQRALGREVEERCWGDASHVRLLRDHPQEYAREVADFLKKCGVVS